MAIEIPTNTALYIPVGPFLDKTDGITPELSITVANSAITLIAGASDETAPTVVLDSVAGNDATNTLVHITGDDAGMHYLKLTAANNNRYGKGMLIIKDTDTYVTVFHEIQWVSAQYYNMKYGTTILNTNTTQISGDSDAADNLELAYDGTGYAGGTVKPKVDLETIKTQSVTCGAGVTINAYVGAAGAPGAANGLPTTNGTKVNQTVDLTSGQSIACSDKTGFFLAATGADLILKSSTFVQAIVAAINEFAAYGLTALNTLITTTGVSLKDGAITASKYDETTAFPLKSADTGATAVARTGADSDTLKTLSDQLDAGSLDAAGVRSALGMASADLDSQLDAILAASGGGAGTSDWTYTVTDSSSGNPIAEVSVWITTDAAGSNTIAAATTNASGMATMRPDVVSGTQVYVWCNKTGYTFENPQIETVTF